MSTVALHWPGTGLGADYVRDDLRRLGNDDRAGSGAIVRIGNGYGVGAGHQMRDVGRRFAVAPQIRERRGATGYNSRSGSGFLAVAIYVGTG